jgi:hypothetical protein
MMVGVHCGLYLDLAKPTTEMAHWQTIFRSFPPARATGVANVPPRVQTGLGTIV